MASKLLYHRLNARFINHLQIVESLDGQVAVEHAKWWVWDLRLCCYNCPVHLEEGRALYLFIHVVCIPSLLYTRLGRILVGS